MSTKFQFPSRSLRTAEEIYPMGDNNTINYRICSRLLSRNAATWWEVTQQMSRAQLEDHKRSTASSEYRSDFSKGRVHSATFLTFKQLQINSPEATTPRQLLKPHHRTRAPARANHFGEFYARSRPPAGGLPRPRLVTSCTETSSSDSLCTPKAKMRGAASVAAVLRPRGHTSKGGGGGGGGGGAGAGGAGGGEEFVPQHDSATLQHTARPVRMHRDLHGNKSGAAFRKLKLNLGQGRTQAPITQLWHCWNTDPSEKTPRMHPPTPTPTQESRPQRKPAALPDQVCLMIHGGIKLLPRWITLAEGDVLPFSQQQSLWEHVQHLSQWHYSSW